MNYIVYKTTCLINNKIYVGVHKTDNPDIFDGYLGRGYWIGDKWRREHPNSPFQRAIAKYGELSFKRETIKVFPGTEEGEDDAFNLEALIVDKDFIYREDTYNVALGGKGRPRVPEPVYKFNMSGKLLESFDSTIEASKSCEISYSCLRNAINNKHSSGGFLWSKIDKIENLDEYTLSKNYFIYDSEGNFVTEFYTREECMEFLGVNRSNNNLSRAINLQNKIKGFFVSYEKYDKLQIVVTKLSGTLNRYSIDGKYIDSFKTAKEARETLGLKLCSLSTAIKLGRICNGYRWTRGDNPPLMIDVKKNNL